MTSRTGSNVAFTTTWSARISGYGQVKTGTSQLLSTWDLASLSHKQPVAKYGPDNGGPFFLNKTTEDCKPASVKEPNNGSREFYNGLIVPAGLLYVDPWASAPAQKTDSQLNAMGTTAVARVEPTNPAFDASVAIGELRNDGLPSIVGLSALRDRANYLKKSGGEYLNVEFGWKPLISDLTKLAHAVRDSEKIVNQYRKGSDTKIRRRYAYPGSSSTALYKTGVDGAGQMSFYPGSDAQQKLGTGTIYATITERQWFSGAFRYHLPVNDTLMGKFAYWKSQADHLLGLRLTPETVWNLAPWSWAIDWFTNTGDVLHNISALGHDGLVMQYGYVMSEVIKTKDMQGTYYGPYGTGPYQCSRLTTVKSAKRLPATPYGFGFNLSTLSVRQTAILAALGLSRVGK